MGYIAPPPPSSYEATLYTIARIYDVGSQMLQVGTGAAVKITPPLHYAGRTWADRHVVTLGYGLLAAVFAFVVIVAGMAQ